MFILRTATRLACATCLGPICGKGERVGIPGAGGMLTNCVTSELSLLSCTTAVIFVNLPTMKARVQAPVAAWAPLFCGYLSDGYSPPITSDISF